MFSCQSFLSFFIIPDISNLPSLKQGTAVCGLMKSFHKYLQLINSFFSFAKVISNLATFVTYICFFFTKKCLHVSFLVILLFRCSI